MSETRKIVFSEVKSRVGIDDVAFSLGYTLNRKAGIGKYFELVSNSDTIIVSNPNDKGNTKDKSKQIYFRRDGSKGDLISFIKDKFDCYHSNGDIDWFKVANVLAKYDGQPQIEIPERKEIEAARSYVPKFNPDRYETVKIDFQKPHWLLSKRGFSNGTVSKLGENIVLIRDRKQVNFDGFNIGFPYRNPETDEITGYEIRGGNSFKCKAAGTDSSHSFWSAEFGDTQLGVRNVYLFESAFDAMAFYQMNKTKLNLSPFALVSMGGSFTQNQIEGVLKRFPNSKLWDCFDNDFAGQTFSKNLVVYADKKPLDILCKNDENGEKLAVLTHGTESVTKKAESFNFKEAAKELGVKYNVGHWKAPSNYKDWNDCLLGKSINLEIPVSKYERNEILYQKRNSSIKL